MQKIGSVFFVIQKEKRQPGLFSPKLQILSRKSMVQTLKKNKVDATLYSRPWKNIRPTWQIRYQGADWLDNYLLSKSTQYKKLLPNALRLTYWNLKPCKSHEKNQTKNMKPLVFSFSLINLTIWCILFCFFMWFARFQIFITEPQRICCKLFVLSWLYCF